GQAILAASPSVCSSDQSLQVSSGVGTLPLRKAMPTPVPAGVLPRQVAAPHLLISLASSTSDVTLPWAAWSLLSTYSLPGSPVPSTTEPSRRCSMHWIWPCSRRAISVRSLVCASTSNSWPFMPVPTSIWPCCCTSDRIMAFSRNSSHTVPSGE